MNLFGSSKNDSTNNNQQYDNKITSQSGVAQGAGSSFNVVSNTTNNNSDYGAVSGALDFAGTALNKVVGVTQDLIKATQSTNDKFSAMTTSQADNINTGFKTVGNAWDSLVGLGDKQSKDFFNGTLEAIKSTSNIADTAINSNAKTISDAASLSYDGLNTNAKMLNNLASYSNDQTNKILNSNADNISNILDTSRKQSQDNMSFLGSLVDNLFLTQADRDKRNSSDSHYYIDATAKENAANRNMMLDAQSSIKDAWGSANNNLMKLSDVFLSQQVKTQNTAIDAIMKSATSAQSATLGAMNGLFEASKSSSERVIDNSLKYIVFGVLGVIALPLVMGAFKK